MKTGKVTQQRSNAGGRKHTDSHKSPECVPPRRIALELRHDRDGRYRWFIQETDEDTEVSGATPEQAWKDAAEVWRGPAWNFEKVSDTVALVDADDPPMAGSDWARRYYALPLAKAMRVDEGEADPWILHQERAGVLRFALAHGDHGAYQYTLRAVKENLPETIAEAIVTMAEHATRHPDDYCARLAFEGAIGAATHYRDFARALAAFAAEDVVNG